MDDFGGRVRGLACWSFMRMTQRCDQITLDGICSKFTIAFKLVTFMKTLNKIENLLLFHILTKNFYSYQ